MQRLIVALAALLAGAATAAAQQTKSGRAAPPPAQAAPEQTPIFQTTPATPPLLEYCAPPVKPACTDDATTYGDAKKRNACQQEMDRYVHYVFAWRVCVNAEVERRVRETNETIQRHRCRVAGGKKC